MGVRGWVGIGFVVAVGVGVVAGVPWAARRVAAGQGVSVAEAAWCADGLCLGGLARAGVRVQRAVVRWDRSVDLYEVEVDPAGLGADTLAAVRGGDGGAGGGGPMGGLPVGEVRVDGLTVLGVPLPRLSGTVHPVRALTGEGVQIDGDVARATVPTRWGEVEVEARPDGGAVVIDARCARCAVSDPALGEGPLTLPPARARLEVEGDRASGTVTLGAVVVEVEGERAGVGARGTFRLPATPVADLYAVLGDGVPELVRADIRGTIEGEGDFDLPDGGIHFVPAVDGFGVQGVLPPGYDHGPFRRLVRTATDERELRVFGEGTPSWIARMNAGELLASAIVAAEDARFRAHPGYDLDGMLAAARDNEARGEVWRGGSTLTQQLAKNLFLDGTRTYLRKARELLYAVEMEEDLGKARILELYLNVVEWGPGIYGAREAAQIYFLKAPAGLLPEEAAWLASILPSPRSAWRDQYLRGRPNLPRVHAVLDNMVGLDEAARAAAKARGVHFVPP